MMFNWHVCVVQLACLCKCSPVHAIAQSTISGEVMLPCAKVYSSLLCAIFSSVTAEVLYHCCCVTL
jgi:hypothetical protein